jgi:hypothetical protein
MQIPKTNQKQIVKNLKGLAESKKALAVLIIMQIALLGILFYVFDPKEYYDTYQNRQVIKQVQKLVQVSKSETPVVAIIVDPDALREENAIQAEVYKDARKDDYVLSYTAKMVIYRPSTKQIIYEGDHPQTIYQEGQQALVDSLVESAKKEGLVTTATATDPQVSIITDPGLLRERDPEFYALAKENDIIGYFPSAGIIVLYRMSEEKILNHGSYQVFID